MIAIHMYAAEHNGQLPPVYTTDKDGKPLHSWRVLLLPYLDEQLLYENIRLDEPWDSEYNKQFHSHPAGRVHFSCPSRRHFSLILPTGFKEFPEFSNTCDYSLVTGSQTAFLIPRLESAPAANIRLNDINGGKHKAIILAERLVPVHWMQPDVEIPFATAVRGIDKEINGVGSFHRYGCHCGFADADVQFIRNDIEPEKWKALLTIDGGENSRSESGK